MSAYPFSIGFVRCPGCGFSAELVSSRRDLSVWTQLRGFLDCNGCPECPADLDLVRTGFVDEPAA